MAWYSSSAGKKSQPRILYLGKIFFGSEWEVKAFSDKENIKEFSPQTYPKGMAKESSWNRKKKKVKKIFEHLEGRRKKTTERFKIWINSINFLLLNSLNCVWWLK